MKKRLKNLKKDERGLTLVELLAVVVILAIVAAIAFVVIGNVIENSKKDAHVANAQQIISAAKLAEVSGDKEFSDTAVNIMEVENEIETLGLVVNPWNKQKYTKAEITKNAAGEFGITLEPGDKCQIVDRTESQLQTGREVCDTTN